MRQLPLITLHRENTSTLLDDYHYYIVGWSGGKDSLAAILELLESGVPRERIILFHQSIDGRPRFLGGEPPTLAYDWPVTESYVRAAAEALRLELRFQWRDGGFMRELLRENAKTAPVSFQTLDGHIKTVGGTRGEFLTRRKFPHVGSIEKGRWCSSILKIDVCSQAITNDPEFRGKNICLITGERREEGGTRSRYPEVERHRASSSVRRVDHYHSVLDRTEREVWAKIEQHNILTHAAYRIGYPRVSCKRCIFGGPDEAATDQELDPTGFGVLDRFEREFNHTIKQGESITALAARGVSHIRPGDDALVRELMSDDFPASRFYLPPGVKWELPRGAFRHGAGPT